MREEVKCMTTYEMDSAYVRRCHKRLLEWGAPLSGWYCEYVYDVTGGDDDVGSSELFTCELCNCQQVRSVHVMRHDAYFEPVEVGCICAGIMEGNILAAKERERVMKNRAKRKQNFPYREWYKNRYGSYQLTYQGKKVFINCKGNNQYSVYVNGVTSQTYKNKPINSFVSAAYAAFELADPVKIICR